MLENFKEELKIVKIVLILLIGLYAVFYVKSIFYPEQLKIVSVYNENVGPFVNSQKFNVGEDQKMKEFMQSAGYATLVEKKVGKKYFPLYGEVLEESSQPLVVIDNGEVKVWEMPKIEYVAVVEMDTDLNGVTMIVVYYLDKNSNIITRFLSL